jgi:hypothetical protein
MKICDFCKEGFVLYITNNYLYFVGHAQVFKPFIYDAIHCTNSEIVLIVAKRSFSHLPKKRLSKKIIKYILKYHINIFYILYREKDLIKKSMESGIYSHGKSILKTWTKNYSKE